MWRLSSPRLDSIGRRSTDERGATAVMVALVMVLLLGFAAISLDVAALFAERQKLQLGADAAALAIARDCAAGDCGTYNATAQKYVTENSTAPGATGSVLTSGLDPNTGQVRVQADATTDHWFAPFLGINETSQSVQAAAKWGGPVAGPAVLPLAFGWCEWEKQTGGGLPSSTSPVVIYTTKTSDTGCTGPSGLTAPGGFGWLAPGADCVVVSRKGDWIYSSPGNSPSCDPTWVAKYQNQTVMLPIFDQFRASGANLEYRVSGYAAFKVTGYYFAGSFRWNSPCGGSDRCIAGYFTAYVTSADWELGVGGVDYGARIVTLSD